MHLEKNDSVQSGKATVLEAALKYVEQCKRVVAVSAVSAYHLGGGFFTGGRHALEESICEQSTLFASLKKASEDAERLHMHVLPCTAAKSTEGR